MLSPAKRSPSWDVVVRLHKIVFILDRRAHQLIRDRLGLAYSQFMIIMALKHRGRISQVHLAEASGLTAAAISRKVNDLVIKGFVRDQVNPRNRRQHVLTLTPAGERAAGKAQEALGGAFDSIFRRLSRPEQTALDRGLQALLDRLCRVLGTIKHLPQ